MENKGQVVGRIAAILSAIERFGNEGARLIDLARETGIARPSVYRLLQDLIEVGYVRQSQKRRYHLGAELYALSFSAAPAPVNIAMLEAVAGELAQVTGDTVYVGMRQRGSVRYLVRVDGSYPVRAQIVEVGQIVPLGATFSGIALLGAETDQQVEQLIAGYDIKAIAQRASVTEPLRRLQDILACCAQVRAQGFCYSRNLVWEGISGLAAPVPVSTGKPYLAISVSAINDRMPEARANELAPLVLKAAQTIAAYNIAG